MFIKLNKLNFIKIYSNICEDEEPDDPFHISILYKTDIKKLNIHISCIDEIYDTKIEYKHNINVIISGRDLETHIKELEDTLNDLDFCSLCDNFTYEKFRFYDDICEHCFFTSSIEQETENNDICSICIDEVKNDFWKSKCCGKLFHIKCRKKAGFYNDCPLCRQGSTN